MEDYPESKPEMDYYGGIEGGGSGSRVVILTLDGTVIGRSEGADTNYWHVGMKRAAERIVQLTRDALKSAGLPIDTRLKSFGMALSGVNTPLNRAQITEAVLNINQNIADEVFSCNDAIGTLVTATDKAAIVLIAGTGSICKLIRPDLSYVRIGGLGYILGDEGSAFWIALQAIMQYMKLTEGLYHSNYETHNLVNAIFEHFEIKSHDELLPHFDDVIDKSFIAALCKRLAEAAVQGDLLCKRLFYDAGFHLGLHVSAVVRQADKEGLMESEGIDVICGGSVFKSWSLLENGFREGVKPKHPKDCHYGRFNLRFLQTTAAIGAAIIGAKKKAGVQLPRPKDVTKLLCVIDLYPSDPYRYP